MIMFVEKNKSFKFNGLKNDLSTILELLRWICLLPIVGSLYDRFKCGMSLSSRVWRLSLELWDRWHAREQGSLHVFVSTSTPAKTERQIERNP
jgi:hypothetical protein